MAKPDVTIRALDPADVEAYRALRLEALATSPDAFSSSHEEEVALSLEAFRARIPTAGRSAIFGAFAGAELVRHVMAHAAKHVLLLQATVVTSNHPARRMYRRLGFVAYGTEHKALCIDGVFHDDALLMLELSEPASRSGT